MDKFWVQKLHELNGRMRVHLAEKSRFEARPERTSIVDLREGQRLKRVEDEICSHFAQLAEFATGVPSDKYNFRLDIKTPYIISKEGELSFGPSALLENHPYLNFDPNKLFGDIKEPKKVETEKEEPVKKLVPAKDKYLEFSKRISKKYEEPVFKIAAARKFTAIRPIKFESRIDRFVNKISKAEQYVKSVTSKFMPESSETMPIPGFFIYSGQFVYLSRKGKWTSVKTTILTQKDYFAKAGISAPPVKRRLPVIEPGKEIEIGDAAEFITDELAEPVSSPTSDLGLGYFIPTRRVGRTESPQAVLKVGAKRETAAPVLPVLGSPEFAADVLQKAESSGHPVEEIGPAYVSMTGRKIDKARSFADILKSKLQLPKSEPTRKAVAALLPKIQEIISKSEKEEAPEDSILALEKDFDSMVEAHVQPFKLAARATGPARFSPVLEQGKIQQIFASPIIDALGVIRKYAPEEAGPSAPAMLSFIRALKPSTTPAPEGSAVVPSAMAELAPGQPAMQEGGRRSTSETARALPGIMERVMARMPAAGIERAVSGIFRMLPGRLGTSRAPAFAQNLIGRFSQGIPGQIGERFGALLQPERLRGVMGMAGRSGIGNLLSRGRATDLIGSIFSRRGSGRSDAEAATGGRSSDVRGALSGAMGMLGSMVRSERVQGFASSIMNRLPLSRVGGMLPQGISRLIPGGTGQIGSLLSRGTSRITETAGQGVSALSDMIAPGESSGGGGLLGRIRGALPALGGIGQRASSMAGGILGRLTGGRTGSEGQAAGDAGSAISGITERAGGMLGGLLGGQSPVGGLVSRASSMAQGIMGRVGGAASGLMERAGGAASGIMQRASGALPGAAGRALSGLSGMMSGAGNQGLGQAQPSARSAMGGAMRGIGSLASRAEGLSGAISGLAGHASEGLGSAVSGIMGRAGAAGAALPSLGGMRQMAEGAMSQIGERTPSLGSMPDMSSMMSGAALPSRIPQQPTMPRGWDRPPFEVGDAIRRHISDEIPGPVGELTRRATTGLRDYGVSVIDLEDRSSEEVRSPLQRAQDEPEVDIDDETIDSIYFRLRRILETESERMGGEA